MCYQNVIAKKTNPTYYMSIVNLFSAVHVQIIGRIGVTSTPRLVGDGGYGSEALLHELEHLRVVLWNLLHKSLPFYTCGHVRLQVCITSRKYV